MVPLAMETVAGLLLLGYALGSIPFGLLLTRAVGLGDIRAIGSGNIGATNVLRTGNRKLAAATLLLDAAKGAVAVLLAAYLAPSQVALWAGLGAVLGHMFPVWLGFRGGKGMATTLGAYLAASWPVGLACCAIWLVVAWLRRISSLGTLIAAAAAPALFWALHGSSTAVIALVIAVLVFVAHRSNIGRLIAGVEPRIGEGR